MISVTLFSRESDMDQTRNDERPDAAAGDLDEYRGYLHTLATLHVSARNAGMIDPSDLVQQTLLIAYRKRAQFRGSSREEKAGWLRRILGNELAQVLRFRNRAKRDFSREHSIQEAIEASSLRLEALLVATQHSPSERLSRHEQVLRVTDALTHLTESQRSAIVMRYAQDMPLDEIAKVLECSAPAVVGLLKRGVRQIRLRLEGDPSSGPQEQ